LIFKKIAFLSPTLLLMVMSVDAKSEIVYANNAALPAGRAQFSAAEATQNLGTLSSDVMLPIYNSLDGFVYGDVMGDYATDGTYIASPGIGYRGLYNNQIFGAYFFDDYQETSLGTHFWVLSPGVEWITPRWDTHLNAYFPTNTRQKNGQSAYADTFGNYSYVNFEEGTHHQYDELVTPYAVIGNGVDAAIGYSFDANRDQLRSRVFLGSYYYQAPSNADIDNITGITAGYSLAITEHLATSWSNSYDQVNHYNLSISLTYVFGGKSNTFSRDVKDRLLDPVERHVGIIATGAGQYDQQSLENQGMGLEYDNVYFTSTNGIGDGTYGNPMALDQQSINNTYAESPEGALIYLQGGLNEIYTIQPGSENETNGLALHAGQDLYGRTADYTAPATGNDRPQIYAESVINAFVLTEGGENTFSDLNIYSSGTLNANTTGIHATNSSSEDEILTINNTSISGFSAGVYVDNRDAGDFTINASNSQFNSNVASSGFSAFGMEIFNSGSGDVVVNATKSQFNNNAGDVSGYGLYLMNQGSGKLTLNATESQFNNNYGAQSAYGVFAQNNNGANQLRINANESSFDGNDGNTEYGIGLYASNASLNALIVELYNSQFNDNSGAGVASGLYVTNTNSGQAIIDANLSQFNGNNTTSADSHAWGLYAGNVETGQLTINTIASEFNGNTAQADSGYAIGLYAENDAAGQLTINTTASEFNANLGGAGGYGMMIYNALNGSVTISATNSKFSDNSLVGLWLDNESTNPGSLEVTNLSGSTFNDNGYYGIYSATGLVNQLDSPNVINTNYTTIENNGISPYNWSPYNW
jgi:hypothetical protein